MSAIVRWACQRCGLNSDSNQYSWYTYSAMNRIYKHYAFKVAGSGRSVIPVTKVMSFSSYPAYLSSLDDFYIMDR